MMKMTSDLEHLLQNKLPKQTTFYVITVCKKQLYTCHMYILTQIITQYVPILFSGAPGYKSVYI